MKKLTKQFILPCTLACLLFAGCGGDNTSALGTNAADVSSSASLETSVLLDEKPSGAIAVSDARGSAPGDEITVEGVIGGVLHPFTEGFAAFVIGDDALVYCNEMEDDHCATPWDACCEDPELRKSSIASVEILDSEGLPIEISAQSMLALKELDKVVVTGTVSENSTPENLIIAVRGIYKQG